MNTKILQINAMKAQIEALKFATGTMTDHWPSLTNSPGWDWLEEGSVKNLTKNDNGWAWNGIIKPLLSQYYVKMNDEMIKEIEREIKKLEEQDEQSSSKA